VDQGHWISHARPHLNDFNTTTIFRQHFISIYPATIDGAPSTFLRISTTASSNRRATGEGRPSSRCTACLSIKESRRTFNDWLTVYWLHHIAWTDLYLSQNILVGYNGSPLIVEVGGSLREELGPRRQKHPGRGLQPVLQDLPGSIAYATCLVEVQRVTRDFLTPQSDSSRGVCSCYLHSIIYDRNDSDALNTLQHNTNSMRPGYSKLFINDVLIRLCEASRRDASVYVHIVAKSEGRERRTRRCFIWSRGSGFELRGSEANLSQTSISEAGLPFLSHRVR
jgi:hypothetical protein